MNLVSLVPSWTETLLRAGVSVVGRTRFCIEPAAKVHSIPAVGGTKNVNWKKVEALGADLVLFDKEENTMDMARSCPLPYIATHVTSLKDVPVELEVLSKKLKSPSLQLFADRWRQVIIHFSSKPPTQIREWLEFPAVIEWWKTPESPIENILYLIWQKPWMAVSKKTFIGSLLTTLGYEEFLPDFSDKYPRLNIREFNKENTLLLFSSEPYNFAKEKTALVDLNYPCALVDGAKFSWFGIRSLEFLEEQAKKFS